MKYSKLISVVISLGIVYLLLNQLLPMYVSLSNQSNIQAELETGRIGTSDEATENEEKEGPNDYKNYKVYKWTDANGKVHFSQTPPDDAVSAEEFSSNKLSTTKFVPAPKINAQTYYNDSHSTRGGYVTDFSRNKKQSNNELGSATECEALRTALQKKENEQDIRVRAKDYDRRKREVDALRWKIRKEC